MNGNMILRGAVALLAILGLGIVGCASMDDAPTRPIIRDANLVEQNYSAADALLVRTPWLKGEMNHCWRPRLWISIISDIVWSRAGYR